MLMGEYQPLFTVSGGRINMLIYLYALTIDSRVAEGDWILLSFY